MLTGFLEDGYTIDGYIDAMPLMYPDVRFTFRPMLEEEINRFSEAYGAKPLDKYSGAVADALAERVKSWSIQNSKGSVVDISSANMKRLHPVLFKRLMGIVWGSAPSDVDPTWTDAQKLEHGIQVTKAQADEATVGQLREESDLKN